MHLAPEERDRKMGKPAISSNTSSPTKPAIDRKRHNTIIIILAAMSAIGPFSTDMYLPGFPAISINLKTDIANVGLSLTSYFIGLSIGQIAYGPLMDRYGRKRPLIVGLLVYIGASLGCAFSPSIHFLVAMRLFVALGSCVGMVGSRAVVRDLFSGTEMARVLSMLMMVFGIAPIIAPTIGSLVVSTLGWRFIFLVQAAIATAVLVAISRFLQESKGADTSVSLRPKNVVLEYLGVFREREFVTYALACTAATAGFISYITGSPFVYMKLIGFTEAEFGWIYGANVVGLIMASQINRVWLRRRSSAEVLLIVTAGQFCLIVVLLTGAFIGLAGKIAIVSLIFGYLFCFGFIIANSVALALQPFTRNAGTASALIGSLQMVAGTLASGLVSCLHNGTVMPMVWVMAVCTGISMVLLCGSALFMERTSEHLTTDTPRAPLSGFKSDIKNQKTGGNVP